MAEFLLEIFGEEIPARMQLNAADTLKSMLTKGFEEAGLKGTSIITHITPRRMIACVEGLPLQTAETHEERRGPKIDAPDAALQGFLKSTGMTRETLTQENGYWYARISSPARQTAQIIPELLTVILTTFPWPKSMRWAGATIPWVRPIRNILCVLDGKPVTFEIPQLGLSTSNKTYGHRFLAPGEILVNDFADYQKKLAAASVIISHENRQQIIHDRLASLTQEKGLALQEDQRLLEEIAGLVEYPVPMLGQIDNKFMHLPKEVMSTSMRVHQKYFTITTPDGKIAPYFGVVANKTTPDNGLAMLHGYETVLRARLSDAAFFYEQDLKVPLESLTPKLDGIVFHAKLGTQGQRIQRLQRLMPTPEGKQAARLCKADLITNMVGEFPELQGIMGTLYARAQEVQEEAALAIREHYLPLGPDAPIPSTSLGVHLALADKADTLVGFFAVGEEPTGSKDPFALRRAALGMIRILREKALKTFNLEHLLVQAFEGYMEQDTKMKPNFRIETVVDFIHDRLKVALKSEGIRHDCVTAVVEGSRDTAHHHNIWALAERAKSLQTFLTSSEGTALLSAFRRANGILANEQKKDSIRYTGHHVSADLFRDPEEQALFAQLNEILHKRDHFLGDHDYTSLMGELARLQKPVDTFFNLKINHDAAKVRVNRLELLGMFVSQTSLIADLAVIQE